MGKNIYVGNLNYRTDEDALRALFSEFGEIESVRLITDRFTGQSKGFAFVEMATDKAADAAIAGLSGKLVDNREIRVDQARPRPDRDRRRGFDRDRDRDRDRNSYGGRPRW
jgi:RNA recognition motif-containing protein